MARGSKRGDPPGLSPQTMTPGLSYRLIESLRFPQLRVRRIRFPLDADASLSLKFIMEDNMEIEPLGQRGTKRVAEEVEPQEPPKPKKIKVRQRVCMI